MNEKQKNEIDELITLLIDGEHTERQKTELKRLIRHDSAVKERLHVMHRQKKFLNSLPIEKAPANLVEDITAAIERKSILETFDNQAVGVSDSKHLLLRRMLTTAAMLLLPVGVLSFVIWEIIKPPSEPAGTGTSGGAVATANDPPQGSDPSGIGLVRQLPFDGTLTLRTDKYITVTNFVQKSIVDQGLVTAAPPRHTADVTILQLSASPEQIALLVDGLSPAWPECSEITLGLSDGAGGSAVEIAQIQPAQIKTLVAESSPATLRQLAQSFQSSNASQDALAANSAGLGEGVPELGVPMLTSRNETPPSLPKIAEESVRLTIHIKRKMD